MNSLGTALIWIGAMCAALTWALGIRPHVRKNGHLITSAAGMGLLFLVDWQNCRILADEHADAGARRLLRIFHAFLFVVVIGFVLLVVFGSA